MVTRWVKEGVRDSDTSLLTVTVPVGDLDWLASLDAVTVYDPDRVGRRIRLCVSLTVTEIVGVTEVLAVTRFVTVSVWVVETEVDFDRETSFDKLAVAVPVTESETLGDFVSRSEVDGDTLGDSDAVTSLDGVLVID